MSDLIDRQAVLDAIQKLNIPEDMCVFEIISHIEVEIATLPSVENKTQMIDKSNFDMDQYKTDLQSAFESGYYKGKIDGIKECTAKLEKMNEELKNENTRIENKS